MFWPRPYELDNLVQCDLHWIPDENYRLEIKAYVRKLSEFH